MGGSVNLQGGGQYQMPGAGYSGMQGSVNAPQTADQYAASMAAKQPAQTGARGPISYNPFTGEPDYSYDPGYAAEPANPWTGTAAPVQNPYYAYGNQTAPMMTASEATGYAPMNIPNMSFARPQFYYPNISNQMAYMQGLGGMGGYGTSMGGKGMQTSPMMGGMGYGGYMGMPGYFSGLGAMGSYMPMMQRSYPTFQNRYPGLGGVTAYQPRIPPIGPTTQSYNPPKPPTTPSGPVYNPDLNPVTPPPLFPAEPQWPTPPPPVNPPVQPPVTPPTPSEPQPQPPPTPPTPPAPPVSPPGPPPPLLPVKPPIVEPPPVDVTYEDDRPTTGVVRGPDPSTRYVMEP